MLDCKAASIPTEVGLKFKKFNIVNDRPYQELLRYLNYLALCTRPDISYVVADLNKFNNSYSEEHWLVAKRMLRYLKGSVMYA